MLKTPQLNEESRQQLARRSYQVSEDHTVVQHNNTHSYRFNFVGQDCEPKETDHWLVERSYLMSDREIESIWGEIAGMNAKQFVRGELEIGYPVCHVSFDGDLFF